MSIEEILREGYGISEDDFGKARKLQQEVGGSLGRILVQIGSITDNQLTEALSKSLNLQLFTGEWTEDVELIAFLDKKLSYKYLIQNNLLPVKIDHDQKILYVATNDPFNTSISDYVVKNLGYRISMSLATESTLRDISRSYIDEQRQEFVSLDIAEDAAKLKEMAFEAPVIKFLNGLISKAVEKYEKKAVKLIKQ